MKAQKLKIDKLLWENPETITKYKQEINHIQSEIANIADHHVAAQKAYIGSIKEEEKMVENLVKLMLESNHFLMLGTILKQFQAMLRHKRTLIQDSLALILEKLLKPLTISYKKSTASQISEENLKNDVGILRKMMQKVDSSMNNYHQAYEGYERLFIEQKISEDVSPYFKARKGAKGAKEKLRKVKYSLFVKKKEYESCLQEYNKLGVQLLKHNGRLILQVYDDVFEINQSVKHCFEEYLTHDAALLFKDEGVKDTFEGVMKQIYPDVELCSFILGNQSMNPFPGYKLQMVEYSSYVVNTFIQKRTISFNQGNHPVIIVKEMKEFLFRISKSLYKNPDLYYEQRKRSEEYLRTSFTPTDARKRSSTLFPLRKNSDLAKSIFGQIPTEIEIHLSQFGIHSTNFFNSIAFCSNFIINCWYGKDVVQGDIDSFIEVVKEENILCSIPKLFTIFKNMEIFEIQSKESFEFLKEMVMICLTESKLKKNVISPMGLFELASAYYLETGEGEARVYLIDGIRQHSIFKRIEFWEGWLLKVIDRSKNVFKFEKRKDDHKEEIAEGFRKCFFSVGLKMKKFINKPDRILKMLGAYFQAYRMPLGYLERLEEVVCKVGFD